MKNKVILIFLDGVGIAPGDDTNPFYRFSMPFTEKLLGGKPVAGTIRDNPGLIFKGIDAVLGVKGIPQSATGQTALFTGVNAPKALGYHHPAFPEEVLKKIIREEALLKKVTEKGLKATFANAYTRKYFEMNTRGERPHSVTTLSVYAAKLEFRMEEDLKQGRAVYWDMTNAYLEGREGIPQITPYQAGKNLEALSRDHHLVVYECFYPDLIGHKRNWELAETFVANLDHFLKGVMEEKAEDTALLISSDHGNMENMLIGGHTTNPSIFLAVAGKTEVFKRVNALTDITPAVLEYLA